MSSHVDVSVVVPIYNERENLAILHSEVARALGSMGVSWEVLYVDDCSDDGSLRILLDTRREDSHVRVVKFRRRCGQTAAMSAGFDLARGELVVTLDGDLQNDPADIPMLVAELRRGFDVVAGWRRRRHDGFVLRRIPSMLANRLIAIATGVKIHDTGCTLKVFRREVVKRLPIYAEQHRFLPVMSASSGARVSEVVVNHRPRRFGRSKYGIGRATRVLLDLLTVKMITQFSQRPLHYFGLLTLPFLGIGVFFSLVGILGLGENPNEPIRFPSGSPSDWVISDWDQVAISICLLLFMLIVYFFLLGLLAELAVKASGMHRRGTLNRILNELH